MFFCHGKHGAWPANLAEGAYAGCCGHGDKTASSNFPCPSESSLICPLEQPQVAWGTCGSFWGCKLERPGARRLNVHPWRNARQNQGEGSTSLHPQPRSIRWQGKNWQKEEAKRYRTDTRRQGRSNWPAYNSQQFPGRFLDNSEHYLCFLFFAAVLFASLAQRLCCVRRVKQPMSMIGYPKKREDRIGPKHKKPGKKSQRERSRLERGKSKEVLLEQKNKNTGAAHQPPMEG